MGAKPILFNTAMVRAILDGRKTVTRRVIKGVSADWEFIDIEINPSIGIIDKHGELVAKDVTGLWAIFYGDDASVDYPMYKSPYQPGDVLYVRECFDKDSGGSYHYKADHPKIPPLLSVKWRPLIHMPKEAARIWLRVVDVGAERLQDITDVEAIDEGMLSYEGWQTDAYKAAVEAARIYKHKPPLGMTPRQRFAHLWDSTIKKSDLDMYGWESNPWVFRIEFERCENGSHGNMV